MSLNFHSSLVLFNIKLPSNLMRKMEGEGTKPSIIDGIQTSGQLIFHTPVLGWAQCSDRVFSRAEK